MDLEHVPSIIPRLPVELLGAVLGYLNPRDIVAFGRTCRHASLFITPENQILWRSAFLHVYEDPSEAWRALLPAARAANAAREREWNWYYELRKRAVVVNSLAFPDQEYQRMHYDELVDALLDIVDTAVTKSALEQQLSPDKQSWQNISVLEAVIGPTSSAEDFIHDFHTDLTAPCFYVDLAKISQGRPMTRSMMQRQVVSEAASRLHIHYGLTRRERISRPARGAARHLVYDWDVIGPDSDFGPFKRDGSGATNWRVLEAVCSVISRNMELVTGGQISIPSGFRNSIPYRTLPDPAVPQDWARVTGSWLGTYSFLDYADLFHFNVGYQPGSRPALDDHDEAHGDLMRLELQLEETGTLKNDQRLKTTLPVCEDLPVLYFKGSSRGHGSPHRPPIAVRGRASLCPDGKRVRWRFLISYGGGDQWQLEGIQPGGIRSGGVYGLWSHCDHEESGPVGPFCYFPMELCKSTSEVLR